MPKLEFELEPTPPFRLDLTAWALKRRPIDIVHEWDGKQFKRVYLVQGEPLQAIVEQIGPPESPLVRVTVPHAPRRKAVESEIADKVTKALGLDIDLTRFYKVARKAEPRLAKLAARFRGFKPPRFASVFESFVCGVACQQLSLHVGILMLNRLVEAYGRKAPGVEQRAFPQPETLAHLQPEQLMPLSYSRNKATYIVEMSRAVMHGSVDLETMEILSDGQMMEALTALKGIGRWTAEYMMLRGFGRLNTFPVGDSGARAKLTSYLGLDKKIPLQQLEEIVHLWSPYSGLLYFHLLLQQLEKEGFVQ